MSNPSSDMAMPSCAFGTFEAGRDDPQQLRAATTQAIAAGFRHLDCAEMYQSTGPVGQALQEALSTIPRGELWVTSKLSGLPCGDYEAIKTRLKGHMAKLRVDYVDLLLCHWPGSAELDLDSDPEGMDRATAWTYFQEHIGEAWDNLNHLKAEGLTRHIGVSNFSPRCLEAVVALPHPAPFAHQLYVDLAHPVPGPLADLHREHRIQAMAYRPLAFLSAWAAAAPAATEALDRACAAAAAADVAQTVLAALLLQSAVDVVVTSSAQEAHMKSNLAAAALAERHLKDAEVAGPVTAALKECSAALVEGLEMVEMFGGVDVWAQAFGSLGLQESQG